MTDDQKKQITNLRKSGCGYTKVAKILGISENTVKTFCRRNNLAGKLTEKVTNVSGDKSQHFCLCCGVLVKQNPGRKEKKFCSDKCRMAWWNRNLDKVQRKAIYEFTCLHCGKGFTSYGNKKRKFCCFECFMADRFGGTADD